jgi:hypothetical protein
MQLHSMALLEDCESIQLSIMHVVDGLLKGTLDATRARLIIQALRIAARNAKNVRFDDVLYSSVEQPMVREVPNYAQQYLIEHPEYGPAISCGADIPVREAKPTITAQRETPAEPAASQPNASASQTAEPTPKRPPATTNAATKPETPAPERKQPQRATQEQKQGNELTRVQAAIAGAQRGNWRDLRTVFEFAGIGVQNKKISGSEAGHQGNGSLPSGTNSDRAGD